MSKTKTEIEDIRKKRDEVNSEVQSLIEKGKKYSHTIKNIHKDIEEIKVIKKSKTKILSHYNSEKNRLKKKIRLSKKKMDDNTTNDSTFSGKNINGLSKKYKILNWKLQTEVMSPKAEEKLSKEVGILEEQLKKVEKLKTLRKDIDEIDFEMSRYQNDLNLLNDLIFDLNQDCGELHSKIINKYNELKNIHTELDPVSKDIEDKKNIANNLHKEFIKEKEKTLSDDEKRKLKDKKKKEDIIKKQKEQDKEQLDKTIEDLKKGKKITLEELTLFQK